MAYNGNYDSDFEVRLATLGKLGGDITKHYDSTYEVDLAILDAIQGGGGGGAVIDDNDVSTGKCWSSAKIVAELSGAGFNVEIVEELPEIGDTHTIYFLNAGGSTGDVYDEYMYINGAWERVGTTSVDLSDYATIANVDASLANYATIANVDSSLALKADKTELSDYATIANVDASLANYATKNDISTFIDAGDLAPYATIANVDASLANYATKNDISTFIDDTALAPYATITNVDASLLLKQDKLTAGANITIDPDTNVISAVGGSSGASIDDNDVSTNTTWSSNKITTYVDSSFCRKITVSTNTLSYQWPTWNSTGQITGYVTQAYLIPQKVNGKQGYFYGTSFPTLSDIYTPTTAGTQGQYLVSNGSGAPIWQDLDLSGYATITNVDSSLALKANASELANYATIANVDASLANYAKTNDISTFITASDLAPYATIANVDSSLSLKADKTDLDSYATIANVDASLANYATTNDISTFISASDLAPYATITNVDASLANYATIANVDSSLSNYFTKAEATASFNPYHTTSANWTTNKFPSWNANGQINGYTGEAWQAEQTINGTTRVIYSTSPATLSAIYAPTTVGTSGYYLVSSGTGEPTWQNLDLSGYATITNVDSSLANKANTSYVDTNFAKLSTLTQAQYDALVQAGTVDASTLYVIVSAS